LTTLIFTPIIYVAMIAAFLITGAGNVINDCVDVDSDKMNASGRPIVCGLITGKKARNYSLLLFGIGILLTVLMANTYMFVIAVINAVLLVFYSYHLQNKILLGNLVVSYLVGSTFLFGGAAMGNLLLPLLLMLLAMLANIAREIVKDLEDLEGDRKSFLKRLVSGVKRVVERFELVDGKPKLKYSRRKAVITAQISLLLAILVSPVPYLINLMGMSYVVLVIITDLIFIWCIYLLIKASKTKDYKRISRRIKLGMLFGLLAFIVGILF